MRILDPSIRNYFLVLVVVYAGFLTTFVVHGCVSAGHAQELASQRQVALEGVAERDGQIKTLEEAIKQGADATTTAIALVNTEMQGLQDELAEQVANTEPGSDPWKESVLAYLTGLSTDRNKFVNEVQIANSQLQEAEDGWGTAQALLSIAGGFFPPAGVGALLIGRGRKVIHGLNTEVEAGAVQVRQLDADVAHHIASFNGVVDAVAKGGGVVNAAATRDAMNMIPGLKDRVTARRVEIGDKEMKAVKAT